MHMPGELLALAIVFIVIGLPTICITLIVLTRIGRGKSSRNASRLDSEDTKLIQELHAGLNRMEKRIEALETIIIEKQKQHR